MNEGKVNKINFFLLFLRQKIIKFFFLKQVSLFKRKFIGSETKRKDYSEKHSQWKPIIFLCFPLRCKKSGSGNRKNATKEKLDKK